MDDLTGPRPAFAELATDLYEWLSLVRLSSPRVEVGDAIDPYLSSYRVPSFSEDGDDEEQARTSRLRRVTWRGFIPPTWVRDALAAILRAVPARSWLALSATSFAKGVGEDAETTFFRPMESGGQYLLWEIRRD